MRTFRTLGYLGYLCAFSLLLNARNPARAFPIVKSFDGSGKSPDLVYLEYLFQGESRFLTQLLSPSPITPASPKVFIERLGGSTVSSPTITNKEKSLSCTLKSWQLIGVINNGTLAQTKGELVFSVTNNSSKAQRIVLAELLFLNDQGKAMTVYNPHRALQGEYIELESPLKPGETREVINPIWYRTGSGWHEVNLKTCRWLQSGDEYWKIYPELKKNEVQ